MLNRKLLFSMFNIAARTYSSKIVTLNHQTLFINRPIIARRTPLNVISTANMSSGDTKIITYEELQTLKENKSVLVIDVREPVELKDTGIIPGSINIPLNNLESILKVSSPDKFHSQYNRDKPDFDTPLVFSCKAGIRSEKAQNIALKLGYSNVRNYKGGWMDWEKHIKKN